MKTQQLAENKARFDEPKEATYPSRSDDSDRTSFINMRDGFSLVTVGRNREERLAIALRFYPKFKST